jgi:hypothetical protein
MARNSEIVQDVMPMHWWVPHPASPPDRRKLEWNDTLCVAKRHVKEKEETNRIWGLLNT